MEPWNTKILERKNLTYPFGAPMQVGLQEGYDIRRMQAVQRSIRDIVKKDGTDCGRVRDK